MSLYIDKKFVSLVSTKLERFKQKSEFLWNFRCPICGDSHKNKLKTRGYFYRRKSDLYFQCHNCGTSLSIGNFLKTIDRSLYREYQLERYKGESSGNVAKPDFSLAKTKPVFSIQPKINLVSIAALPINHAAGQYLLSRKIPRDKLHDIYYAPNFREFVMEMLPNYDKALYDEPRIIFPFYDQDKKLLGFQGRAIGESKVKYITIKMDEDFKKIYGLDRVDLTKRIYVVEGPIDSLFLQNSLATMDASLYNITLLLGNYDYVFIHDNEPRNHDIVKQMNKTIRHGDYIFIWPQNIVAKDINDWIMTGATGSEIQSVIDRHTFNDLRAKLEFEQWKKV
jgi:predicted RNA-binding Zn-ribbon protein involved in translation (DUF1610 family)